MNLKTRRSDREAFELSNGPEMAAAFPLAEYKARHRRLQKAMSEANVDVLFLTAPESMNWLTGYAAEWYQGQSSTMFQPISGVAVSVDADHWIHFDQDMESVLIGHTTVSNDVRLVRHEEEGPEFIARELKAEGWTDGKVFGIEKFSARPNRGYSEKFQAAIEAAGATVVDITKLARGARRIKSPAEIAATRRAQQIADIGMRAAYETIAPGVTELEVYGEIVRAMARAGGENPGITMPVSAGRKSPCVHGLASRRVIMPGDIVIVDVSGVYNRYHANMARTFSVGEPDQAVAARCEQIYGAMDLIQGMVRPHLPVRDLLNELKAYYGETGLLEESWWIGGYELGIAFPPDWVGEFFYELTTDPGEDTFLPGDVVNYEANFYLPKSAGLAMSINTLVFEETEAGFINKTANRLHVIENC